MIIQSIKHRYETIEEQAGKNGWVYYQAYRDGEDSSELYDIAAAQERNRIPELIPVVMELERNTVFSDFEEAIQEENRMILVFQSHPGERLSSLMEHGMGRRERYDAAGKALERCLAYQIPEKHMADLLDITRIKIDEYNEVFLDYRMPWDSSGKTLREAWKELLETLFSQERADGLYPEIEAYLSEYLAQEGAGGGNEAILLYQEYVGLLPAVMEEREKEEAVQEEKKEDRTFKDWVKQHKKELILCARLLAAACLILLCIIFAPILWRKTVFPVIQSRYLVKEMADRSAETLGYSGKVRLLSEDGENTVFAGILEDGKKTGFGTEWDQDGRLIYEGTYQDGLYEGSGTRYYPNGQISFQGTFSMGKEEGSGIAYDETGQILYDGTLSHGMYDGEGCVYWNGEMIYDGELKNGLYDGEGKQYAPGKGMLVYEGSFVKGLYEGEGKKYNPDTGFLQYEGNFRSGKYDGAGKEYDEKESLRYEGEFRLGVYHGTGTYYDTATGLVIVEGNFRGGQLAATIEEIEAAKAERDKRLKEITGEDEEVPAEESGEEDNQGESGTEDIGEEEYEAEDGQREASEDDMTEDEKGGSQVQQGEDDKNESRQSEGREGASDVPADEVGPGAYLTY
ncbi:hypothetical protein [Clostridium sp. AM58-1XD]|uniref:hypothetical protein n=1 Tax=Clostridium sp. AM58-1XD TaxID=2292307 RepID=UPI000E51E867|nr:hypothetical protein [Clostridium sp. AM58-1XD]RGY98562.1 hypothetical protein DXA13_10800 [Clostridium sp. AM58-1XD]